MRTPSKHATDEFPWQTNNPDEEDLICELKDYTLRVEQMDDSLWWWKVYYKGEWIHTDKDMTSSKYRAIGLAEGTYLGYSITLNQQILKNIIYIGYKPQFATTTTKIMRQLSQQQLENKINTFNNAYSVGDKVEVMKTSDGSDTFEAKINHKATILGGHTAVTLLEGKGSYDLDFVVRKL